MEIATIAVPCGEDYAPCVDGAVGWLGVTHPDLLVKIADASLELSGPYPAQELQRFWNIALLNEQLVLAGAANRDRVLEGLVR